METKKCTKCGEVKSFSEFHNNKRRKDGKQEHCKQCRSNSAAKKHLEKTGGKLRDKTKSRHWQKEQDELRNIKKKRCSICEEIKVFGDFYKHKGHKDGLSGFCIECTKHKHKVVDRDRRKLWKKQWCLNNINHIKAYREKRKEEGSDWYSRFKDTDKVKDYRKKYYIENKKEIYLQRKKYIAQNRERINEYYNDYRDKHRGKINKQKALWSREKVRSDALYALKRRLSSRIRISFSQHGYAKNSKSQKILGCSWETAKNHMESQFTNGMTWENYGDWHIDHIIPLASANTKEELIKLNHYKNLQPLWAEDNLRKGSSMPPFCVEYKVRQAIG